MNEDDAVHNPAAKSGSDRSSCPDALPTDLSAADDLSLRRRVLRVPSCRVLDVLREAVLVSLSLPSPKWSSQVWFDYKTN